MGEVLKIRKKTLFALGLRKSCQKVAKKMSSWPPESIQNPPKTVHEFNTKIWWRTQAENTKFNVQIWSVFLRFLLLKSTSKGTWSPAGRQNWKFMKEWMQKYQKSTHVVLISSLKLTKIGNSKHPKKQYQNPCDFVWIKLPSPLNGLAVCAERLNYIFLYPNF